MQTTPDWTTLRIFLTAIEVGSIAKAADRCGLANSAAAKRIQTLEARSGVRLLERHARGVATTAAGETFARYARMLMETSIQMAQEVADMAGGRVGTVRFSAAPTAITGHNLAERLAEFAWAHPKIRTELRESTSVPILHDLYQGRLDLGIVSTNVRLPSGLEGQAWRDDRLVVVVPIGHPLEKRRSVRFVDVLDHSMVETLADGALALLLADRARQLGRRPQYRYHVASMDSAQRLVAAGLAINVMPSGVAQSRIASLGVASIPLNEPWAVRQLRIVSRPPDMLSTPTRLLRRHLLQSAQAVE